MGGGSDGASSWRKFVGGGGDWTSYWKEGGEGVSPSGRVVGEWISSLFNVGGSIEVLFCFSCVCGISKEACWLIGVDTEGRVGGVSVCSPFDSF